MKKPLLISALLLLCSINIFAQWDKDVFSLRGRQALSDGKFSLAIENFNILARLDTSDYYNFYFRGIAKYNLGDFVGAKADFSRSVRINPVFTGGYHFRSITESRTGDYTAALEDIKKAIDLRPGLHGLYYSRGVTYFLSQRFDYALKDFNYYIKKEPDDPSAYLNRGATKLFLKDTLGALDDYNKAIQLDRFEAESFVRRSRIYNATGRNLEALADLNRAIELDTASTFTYFNRAIIQYELKKYNEAVKDLNKVLEDEPGNALTLYNRSLIYAQVGMFDEAIADLNRVIKINPENVLAYFNRASVYMEKGQWKSALKDYDKAIELYPDFAKAYLNRSYAELQMGMNQRSKQDYATAQKKLKEFTEKSSQDASAYADTSSRFSSLLALDAEFARKDFDNEYLQYRDVDVNIRPLYKFVLTDKKAEARNILSTRYENPLLEKFLESMPEGTVLSNTAEARIIQGNNAAGVENAENYFIRGLMDLGDKRFASAQRNFEKAVSLAGKTDGKDEYKKYFKAFYLMNKAVLKAEMIDFIASLEGNVQNLSMDEKGTTRTKVSEIAGRTYDYSEAIADINAALAILPDLPYLHFNLANMKCLSSDLIGAIKSYGDALKLYPMMAESYFNRGLVLIYLKDNDKGCADLSRAGELGLSDAYSVIGKYCKKK